VPIPVISEQVDLHRPAERHRRLLADVDVSLFAGIVGGGIEGGRWSSGDRRRCRLRRRLTRRCRLTVPINRASTGTELQILKRCQLVPRRRVGAK
jgi:hypothetical protein